MSSFNATYLDMYIGEVVQIMNGKSNEPDTFKDANSKQRVGPITEPDRLFNDIAVIISDEYTKIGTELGLQSEVLHDELETGILKMERGSKKALKMLQMWRNSVSEDKCTYSVLATALIKHGLQRCAYKYCYTTQEKVQLNL